MQRSGIRGEDNAETPQVSPDSISLHPSYGNYQWRALHWQLSGIDVNAGIPVAAFDGYPRMRDGGWFVVPLPLLSIEGRYLGANLTVVPTIGDRLHGAIAVQFKLRVR